MAWQNALSNHENMLWTSVWWSVASPWSGGGIERSVEIDLVGKCLLVKIFSRLACFNSVHAFIGTLGW